MFDFAQKEVQRPEFDGKMGKDPVSGKIKKLNTKSVKWRRITNTLSISVIMFFIAVVVAIVAGLFIYRSTLHGAWDLRFVSFLNAI